MAERGHNYLRESRDLMPLSVWNWKSLTPAIRGAKIQRIAKDGYGDDIESLAEAFAQLVEERDRFQRRVEELNEWKRRSIASRAGHKARKARSQATPTATMTMTVESIDKMVKGISWTRDHEGNLISHTSGQMPQIVSQHKK
jgi:hypothetical protein